MKLDESYEEFKKGLFLFKFLTRLDLLVFSKNRQNT